MSLDKNTTEKIDNYLFDLLSASEKKAFEKEIEQNKILAKAVKAQKLEHRTMQLLTQNDLRANLNEGKQEKQGATFNTAPKQEAKVVSMAARRRRMFQFAAAASIALVAVFFIGNQFADNNYGSNVLADNAFSSTFGKERSSDTSGNFPVIYRPALAAMNAGNYEKALELLTEIDDSAYAETSKILQAECYFEMKHYNNCITTARQVAQNGEDESNVEKAEWYLVLAYFAAERPDDANPILTKILANKNHAFYPYAVKFKEELESFWGRWAN